MSRMDSSVSVDLSNEDVLWGIATGLFGKVDDTTVELTTFGAQWTSDWCQRRFAEALGARGWRVLYSDPARHVYTLERVGIRRFWTRLRVATAAELAEEDGNA